jgi:hypothetical protein
MDVIPARVLKPLDRGRFGLAFGDYGLSPSAGSSVSNRSKSDSNKRSCTMRYFSNSLSAWALDGVILDDLVRPFAELHGALVLDLETHGDDRLQAVVFHGPLHLATAFGLND